MVKINSSRWEWCDNYHLLKLTFHRIVIQWIHKKNPVAEKMRIL